MESDGNSTETTFFSSRGGYASNSVKIDDFRQIYSQPLDVRVGPLAVRRLSLNRHLPEKDWVATHSHAFSQFLLYLHGRGSQRIGEDVFAVIPGAVFLLPPRVSHAFVETAGRRPLCLAIDFRTSAGDRKPVAGQLTRAELHEIREALAFLHRWQDDAVAVEPREAAAVLRLLDVLLRASGQLERGAAARSSPAVVRRVREVIEKDPEASVARIAGEVGYHRDHLNRMLKTGAGLSIGQIRSEIRLKRAKQALRHHRNIDAAAMEAGFADPNYFSRWFRQQTGRSPSDWRRIGKGAAER